MKQLLLYLLAGSRGGATRARILAALLESPVNANQLAQKLSLDYKTVKHHVKMLLKNRIIQSITEGYGTAYTTVPEFDKQTFMEIWERFGKR